MGKPWILDLPLKTCNWTNATALFLKPLPGNHFSTTWWDGHPHVENHCFKHGNITYTCGFNVFPARYTNNSLDLILNAPANSKTCVLGNPAISNFFSLPSETKLTYPRELHGVKTTPLSMYTIVNKFQFCSHTVWMPLQTVDSRAPPFLWLNSTYCWHKLFFSCIIILLSHYNQSSRYSPSSSQSFSYRTVFLL